MPNPVAAIRTVLTGILVLMVACAAEPESADVPVDATVVAAAVAFQADQQRWRDQRVADLTRADGWTSLVGMHWIDPGPHFLGSAADNGIRIAVGPDHLGMIDLRNGALRFVPESGTAVALDGEPLKSSAVLRADDAATGPSVLAFDEGKGQAHAIKRGTRYALRVKHADARTRTGFTGLDYWPTSAGWRVDGRFVAHAPGKTLPVPNIIGTVEPVPNPGVVEFAHDGTTHRIEALDMGGDALFLVFADRTSGHGSYSAGRYLDAPRPDAKGRVTLDFNRAYNPPCAFTAFATCPLPPPENRLDLAIAAGEKQYTPPR